MTAKRPDAIIYNLKVPLKSAQIVLAGLDELPGKISRLIANDLHAQCVQQEKDWQLSTNPSEEE